MTERTVERSRLPKYLQFSAAAFLVLASSAPARETCGWLSKCRALGSASAIGESPMASSAAQAAVDRNTDVRDVYISTSRGRIAGTLTLSRAVPHPPIVIMLHGYLGDRNELSVNGTKERMFQRTARVFGDKGLATLRFDFINSGASDGHWEQTTFSGQTADASAVLDYVASMSEIDPHRVGVLGFSQGGLVALKAAAQYRRIGAVVLWNPVLDPERTYSQILSAATVQRGYDLYRTGHRDGVVDASRLEPSFMFEVKTTYPIADGASFAGPLLIVGGQRDKIAGPTEELAHLVARARAPQPTEIIIVDGDHGFDHSRGAALIDNVISRSGQFFVEVLSAH